MTLPMRPIRAAYTGHRRIGPMAMTMMRTICWRRDASRNKSRGRIGWIQADDDVQSKRQADKC